MLKSNFWQYMIIQVHTIYHITPSSLFLKGKIFKTSNKKHSNLRQLNAWNANLIWLILNEMVTTISDFVAFLRFYLSSKIFWSLCLHPRSLEYPKRLLYLIGDKHFGPVCKIWEEIEQKWKRKRQGVLNKP